MPCRYDPTDEEIQASKDAQIAAATAPLIEKLDAFTHENDMLRELVLTSVHDQKPVQIDNGLLSIIAGRQIEHRQGDLTRLARTFTEAITAHSKQGNTTAVLEYADRLRKVTEADPRRPLEDQLGFDADAF